MELEGEKMFGKWHQMSDIFTVLIVVSQDQGICCAIGRLAKYRYW